MKCAYCDFVANLDIKLGYHHYKAHIFPKPKIDLKCPVCFHFVPDVLQHFQLMHKNHCPFCAQLFLNGNHSFCKNVKERGRIYYCYLEIFEESII